MSDPPRTDSEEGEGMSDQDEPGISVTEFEHRHPEFRNEQDWVGPAWLRALADCERTDADLSRKVPREHLREHAAELDAQADQWERDRNEIERLKEGLRDIDPTWLDKLALWLDEDDRLMREHYELGNFYNRETGEPMDPETQRATIAHRSDDGTQQRLRSYADLVRNLLEPNNKETD